MKPIVADSAGGRQFQLGARNHGGRSDTATMAYGSQSPHQPEMPDPRSGAAVRN